MSAREAEMEKHSTQDCTPKPDRRAPRGTCIVSQILLLLISYKVWESGCGAMFTPKGPYPNDEREDRPWLLWLAKFFLLIGPEPICSV